MLCINLFDYFFLVWTAHISCVALSFLDLSIWLGRYLSSVWVGFQLYLQIFWRNRNIHEKLEAVWVDMVADNESIRRQKKKRLIKSLWCSGDTNRQNWWHSHACNFEIIKYKESKDMLEIWRDFIDWKKKLVSRNLRERFSVK